MMDLVRAFRLRWAAPAVRAVRNGLGRVGSAMVGPHPTRSRTQEWHSGDIVWYARLEEVGAAVVESVTPQTVTLAIGSSRYTQECGRSPTGPALFHSKAEALRYMRERRSRIVRVLEHDSISLDGKLRPDPD